jgi:protoporphyrinogen oxidase
MQRVIVLGAGPAGVGAALMLARSGKAEVQVLERAPRVGGNSGSFVVEGVHCDFGSHRLHPASEPHLLEMIKEAVGPDLLWRPRHGRIRLKGRWIHFPLKPLDLLLRLPKAFTAQLMWDAATKPFRRAAAGEPTFASVLHQGLGPAMCQSFYFPYMRKLWALPPEELAVTLATRRVSGSSIGKILKKILGQVPGLKKPQAGGFYYPRKGFGQISESLRSAAEELGADFTLETAVAAIEHEDGRVKTVRYRNDGVETRVETSTVWSTLPLTTLVSLMDPPAPPAVTDAASRIRYRGMILIYLVLEQDQFTEYDAHYFPEYAVPISRLSEPKNYSASTEPAGVTVLCAELPCDPQDELWALSDDELGATLCEWLAGVGLPVTAKVRRTETRRLGFAYPVYDRGFEGRLKVLDEWIEGMQGLLTFGRQGLFAHDNTHHALAMADGAVDCLNADGSFDLDKWHQYRRVFETHVVED